MSDWDDWGTDPLPDFDAEDPNRGDTDLPPITLGRFEIAAGVFVTVQSLTGELPSPRDLNLNTFQEFLGIQESAAVREVRGLEQAAPQTFDFTGKGSRGPFTTRQEVAKFLDNSGLMGVANVYITDLFGDYPDEDTPDEFIEWWVDTTYDR